MALIGGAVGLGVVVVLVGFVIGSGNEGPTGLDPSNSPSIASSPSIDPSPRSSASSGEPSASPSVAPSASPTGPSLAPATDSFAILPGQQPADFVPEITCSGQIGATDPVAIVEPHADPYTGNSVLRNYADPSNPRTVCEFAFPAWDVPLVDSRHLVISAGSELPGGGSAPLTFAVVDLPGVRYHWFQLPVAPGYGTTEGPAWYTQFVAVSPELDEIVWLKSGRLGTNREVHITDGSGDRVVASLPDSTGGRCGSAEDSKYGAYSSSGTYLFVHDQLVNSLNTLQVFRGSALVLSVVPPPGGWTADAYPAVPIWSRSSDTLYFRQGGDVWQWTPDGGKSLFLSDVRWYRPSITPDGRHLAFAAARTDGAFGVFLMDLVRGDGPQLITQARDGPVFLNNSQLWYKTPNIHGCAGSEQDALIYDIEDELEFPSVIDRVYRIWPGTSSYY